MQVKIKKLHPEAVIPKYAKPGDAGLDLIATSRQYNYATKTWDYGTGLSIEVPEGHVGLLFPRSSLTKYDLSLGNHVGVIDSGFRGELFFKFKELLPVGKYTIYVPGDKVGQLIIIPYPKIQFVEVDELSDSERGTGGFGSSGN